MFFRRCTIRPKGRICTLHVQNLRYHQFLINLFVYEKAIIFCHVCHGVCTVAGTGDPRDKGSHA